jgi:catechol 2,3-dioxygenase-like lactoylglutathione lyase family enzyme
LEIPVTQTEAVAWPKFLEAITLFVEELDATKRFYRTTFGLPVVFENENSAVFKMGGTLINLLKIESANELIEPAQVARRDAGSRHVFTIEVDDVDTMCTALTARGVTLLNGPMDRPWGIRTASFQDPAGNIWEIAR